MIEIRPLTTLALEDTQQICTPFDVAETYRVVYSDSAESSTFSLGLTQLTEPHTHHYNHFDTETLAMYNEALPQGFSFGAYIEDQMIGFLVAEKREWNNSLWVWEFHVAQDYQGQGVGRRLMDAAAEKARAAGLRTIVCETQNQNVQAIRAYRAMGFRLEGIDISYYTNEDFPDRGIAVFMKRRL